MAQHTRPGEISTPLDANKAACFYYLLDTAEQLLALDSTGSQALELQQNHRVPRLR